MPDGSKVGQAIPNNQSITVLKLENKCSTWIYTRNLKIALPKNAIKNAIVIIYAIKFWQSIKPFNPFHSYGFFPNTFCALRDHRPLFLNYDEFISLKMFFFLMANSADLDEMPLYAAYHLSLHFLPKYMLTGRQYPDWKRLRGHRMECQIIF